MAKVTTNFDPQKHGFHFRNDFVNHVVSVGDLDINTLGLCGGMAFASLDYYYAGLPIPTHMGQDFPNGSVPPDGSRLRGYIYDRLMDSFALNGITYVAWTLRQDHHTDLGGDGVFEWTKNGEFPKLMQLLQLGPVPLGLISARWLWDIGNNHQVVAHAAELDAAGTMTVWIYDNNAPNEQVILTRTANQGRFWSSLTDAAGQSIPYRGWFVESYAPRTPPYIDLALSQPLSVNPASVAVGEAIDCTYTIKNYGDYTAHVQSLDVQATVPAGESADKFPGDLTITSLPAGQEILYIGHCDCFAGIKGTYKLRPTYHNLWGLTIDNIPRATWRNDSVSGRQSIFAPAGSLTLTVNALSRAVTDPPPYVESVEAMYMADNAAEPVHRCEYPRLKLKAEWVPGALPTARKLNLFSEPILPLPSRTLHFTVKFATPGAMRPDTVKLTVTGMAPDGVGVTASIPLSGSGRLFTGTWRPPQRGGGNYPLTLRIQGADDCPRYSRRTPRGDVLDANPSTVAGVATGTSGYPFQNYEPGTDTSYCLDMAGRCPALPPDALEPNDSFAAAREVALTGATPAQGTWRTFPDLSFDSDTDQDYFLVRYDSLPDDDTWPTDGPITRVISNYPRIVVTDYPPYLSIIVTAGLCHKLTLYPDPVAGGLQYGPYMGDYRLYNPTRTFPKKCLYAVLENANYAYQGAFAYTVEFGYAPGFSVTSGSSDGFHNLTQDQAEIQDILFKQYNEMLDLPRPPEDMLTHQDDRGFPVPDGAAIVADRKDFVARTEAYFTTPDIVGALQKAVGERQAQATVAGALGSLGDLAAQMRLDDAAEHLYRTSAETFASVRLAADQVHVLQSLAAFYDARLMTKDAEQVRLTITGIRL